MDHAGFMVPLGADDFFPKVEPRHNLGTIGGLKGNEGQQAILEQTENSEEKSWAHQDSNLGPADY